MPAESDQIVDADKKVVQGRKAPSERVRLDRTRILRTAVDFVDERGLRDLTMRRLGAELGVEAMSLYRYVPGREELLDGIVETVLLEMDADPDVSMSPQDGWQDFLQRMAHGVRRLALAHPAAFPLIASRPTDAPWLRPPLRSLEWVESFLKGMIDEGFTDAAAAAAYRGFTSFLLGHLLLEVSTLGADIGPLDVIDPAEDESGLDDFPHVRRLGPALSEDHSAAEFEESLEALLDRLAVVLTKQAD